MSSAWVPIHSRARRPRLRVFCVHHAGGAASAFRPWATAAPEDMDVCAVQLPGREGRFGEPFATSIADVAAPLARAVLPLLDVPFALVGNSMGALVAFEVARYLHRHYLLSPVRLVVAAAHPPGTARELSAVSGLPDAELVARMQDRHGGIPDEILAQPEFLAAYLPILRADMAMTEAYRPAGGPVLRCPVTAYAGADDRPLQQVGVDGWRAYTAGAFDAAVVPGGHFALIDRPDLVFDRLRAGSGRSPEAGVAAASIT